ncbi:hypothetical protein V1517DRAFT_369560 [Lipomyces orientalis]|uniref:Uncharacterized protein n=1 Tax=Lipomyces orientalis TaxID=1233043 RepID=A0ACC3TG14_9ASCO
MLNIEAVGPEPGGRASIINFPLARHPPTRPRRKQAIDYLLLNDGYDGDEPMENILPDPAQSSVESFEVHDLESSPILTASKFLNALVGPRIGGGFGDNLKLQPSANINNLQTLSGQSRILRDQHLQPICPIIYRGHGHGLPLGFDNVDATQSTIMTTIVREESHSLGRADKTTVYCH